MKTILQNNHKTQQYLRTLTPIYIVALWARYGVDQFYFSGKFRKDLDTDGKIVYIPLVWQYNDHNGTADQYELVPITHTTTGFIKMWTFQQEAAAQFATYLNKDIT